MDGNNTTRMLVDHMTVERGERPFGAVWVLNLPWAHPFWSQYLVTLADLTTPLEKPATIARPGMTHEVIVWAIDPEKPVEKWADRQPGCLLQPANHAYQFKADDDKAAHERIAKMVSAMIGRRLSPDTDYTPAWDHIFKDGVSLKSNVFERFGQTVQ